jgi:hypothetical protein
VARIAIIIRKTVVITVKLGRRQPVVFCRLAALDDQICKGVNMDGLALDPWNSSQPTLNDVPSQLTSEKKLLAIGTVFKEVIPVEKQGKFLDERGLFKINSLAQSEDSQPLVSEAEFRMRGELGFVLMPWIETWAIAPKNLNDSQLGTRLFVAQMIRGAFERGTISLEDLGLPPPSGPLG